MKRQFRYRIYPTKKQKNRMNMILSECCWLYNHLLELRIKTYQETNVSLSNYDCQKMFKSIKEERPSLNVIHSQSVQQVSERIELAFQSFFRRIKSGEKPGFPRFKGIGWYDSFTYPQSGFKISNNKLILSKIGYINIKLHRPIEGKIKRLTVKRTPTGKWFVSFIVDVEPKPLPMSSEIIGIDLGLKKYATLSNGETIDAPKFFRIEEKSLAKSKRKYQKEKNKKNKKVMARIHERIGNKRLNWCNQLAYTLVKSFQIIVFEDLDVKSMQQNGFNKGFNKSLTDAAWGKLINSTQSAAESATRTVVLVNPCNTSQLCSQCGILVKKSLSERTHKCDCGLEIDRDLNAACNILALGLQRLAKA